MNFSELIAGLSILGVYPPSGGGGGGTVTNVGSGTGLTGGPITTTGTLSLATIPTGDLLANISGIDAAPIPTSLSDLMDDVLGNTQGDILYRNATGWTILPPGSANYFLRTNGPSENPSWEAVGSGVFNAANTIYFADGGDDSWAGTIDFPVATLAQAVTLAQAIISAGDPGTVFVQIIGMGIGIDTSNVSLSSFNSSNGIDIWAPGWQFNPPSGDALTITLGGGPSPSYFNCLFGSCTTVGDAKAVNLVSTTPGHGGVTRFNYLGKVDGNVSLAVQCDFNALIVLQTLVALSPYTNVTVLYGVSSFTQTTRLNIQGYSFGAGGGYIHGPVNFSNVARYPMRNVVQLTEDITLDDSSSGYLYVNNSSSNYTITLPDTTSQGTPGFLVGYEATFLNESTGSITFTPNGSASLIGATVLNQVAQRANCTLTIANVWEVDQNLLPVIGSAEVLSNLTGGNAIPIGNSMSDILDYSFDNVQGGILFRSAAAWQFLAAGSAGYVLSTGGVSADPSWIPPFGASEAFNTVVPWTNFQYLTWYEGNNAWFPAGAQNDPAFPQPPLPANFGSTNLFVPFAGTYQFTVVTMTYPDSAILHFNINGVDTYVDAYAASGDGISYVWTQALVAGNNIIAFDALTKNPSSTDYQVRLRLAGLMVASV